MNDPSESLVPYNQATHAYIMERLDSLSGRVHLLESKVAERDNSVDGIPEKLSGDIPEAMRFYDLLDIEKSARETKVMRNKTMNPERLIEELNARIFRYQSEPYCGQIFNALIQVRDAVQAATQDVKPCENCGSPEHGIGGCQETFHP